MQCTTSRAGALNGVPPKVTLMAFWPVKASAHAIAAIMSLRDATDRNSSVEGVQGDVECLCCAIHPAKLEQRDWVSTESKFRTEKVTDHIVIDSILEI
jgi:hypothetical protein